MSPTESKYNLMKCSFSWKDQAEKTFFQGNFEIPAQVLNVSYRVNTETVCACDVERVVFVCKDNDVRNWVDTQGVIERPVHRTDIERQRSQMTLG